MVMFIFRYSVLPSILLLVTTNEWTDAAEHKSSGKTVVRVTAAALPGGGSPAHTGDEKAASDSSRMSAPMTNGDDQHDIYKRSVLITEVDDESNDSDDSLVEKRHYDFGYGSRVGAADAIAQAWDKKNVYGAAGPGKRSSLKRMFSDFGYGSRMQAAENLANGGNRDMYGIYGPGKRSADFGYGSRLTAGENLAKAWGRDKVYGVYGPGKRAVDFGYGSRMSAGENVANSMSGDLYGVYGPGKRSVDFGYGSRLQAGENVARSLNNGLYGIYGPGKRALADFGYGSRIKAAEDVGGSSNRDKLFGIYGPGKRADEYVPYNGATVTDVDGKRSGELDSGYGSRVQAGSQVASDLVAMSDLFGDYGPGKNKRDMDGAEVSEKEMMSKRSSFDMGYGSRIFAGSRLARSKQAQGLFGSDGPGK